VSALDGVPSRARKGDRARIILAIVLIFFTALVGMLGAAPPPQTVKLSVGAKRT
jgi:hypothetical protein